jgi:myo-inositol-1(or 4)-monophosphatase
MNESFADTAKTAALKAGEIHLSYFGRDIRSITKSSHYDIVTVADLESEDLIVSVIRERFPDHNILAEEKKYEKTESEFTWIIDPLDGTNNFAHRIPVFSVSIALAFRDKVVLGAVYDASRSELFTAESGKGAFLNNSGINVSPAGRIDEALLTTGFYYDRGESLTRALDDIRKFLIRGIVGIRRFGSAALDLCNVACGRGEGFWEFMLNPWDFAAGKLIVEEAGGKVTDEKGHDVGIGQSYIVASNGKIHDEMLAIVGESGPREG